MKTLYAVSAFLLAAVFVQMPSTPPMKMGLWSIDMHTKMNIPDLPAAMAGLANRNTKVKSCLTPESYAKSMSSYGQGKDCTRSNEVWNSKGYSFDSVCSKGKTTSHSEMTFDSPEKSHGTVHTETAGPHGPTTGDSEVTMTFLGADCGSITPDKPQIVH